MNKDELAYWFDRGIKSTNNFEVVRWQGG